MSNALLEAAEVLGKFKNLAANSDAILSKVEGARAELAEASRSLKAAQSELLDVRTDFVNLRARMEEERAEVRQALDDHALAVKSLRTTMLVGLGVIILGMTLILIRLGARG